MAKSIKPSSNSSDANKKKIVSTVAAAHKTKSPASAPIDANKAVKTDVKNISTKSANKDKVEKKPTPVATSKPKKVSPVVTTQPQIKKKKFPAAVVFGKHPVKKVEEKHKVEKNNSTSTKKTQAPVVAKVAIPTPKATTIKPPQVKPVVEPKIEAKKATNTKKVAEVKPIPVKKVDPPDTKAVSAPKTTTSSAVAMVKPTSVAKKSEEIKPVPLKENTAKIKTTTVTPALAVKKAPAPQKAKIAKSNIVNVASSKPVKPVNKGDIRYSDEDLAIFKQVIDQQKNEIIEEINSLNERIEAFNSRDFTEESTYSLHMAEQTGDAIEAERARNRISDLTELVKKLNDAIIRIDNKTYGICRICNCLIAKERLLVVPVTTLSASYKLHGKCPEDGIDRTEKK